MDTQRDRHIADEVDKTLRALDDDIVLEENPFLVTRVLGGREGLPGKRFAGTGMRIAPGFVLIALILLMNVLTVVRYIEWNRASDLQEKLVAGLEEDLKIEQTQNSY